MKAAANGALNLSTLDGWWDEAWECGSREWDNLANCPTSAIGWTIGRGEIYDDPEYQDQVEAEALYDLLEGDVIPTFYDRGEDKLPRRWIERMKASIGSLCHFFNTHRMVREYAERFYLPAAERQGRLAADGMALARSLAAWKERVRDQWSNVRIKSVTAGSLEGIQVNSEIKAQAEVSLGALTPDDVSVELYLGLVNAGGEVTGARAIPMRPVGDGGEGRYRFEVSSVACCRSGLHGFTVRALPCHPDLIAPFLPGLIVWAQADTQVG
jgi:starch phosphorylase